VVHLHLLDRQCAGGLLLFVSVLLHELSHSLVARRRGLPVKNITLFIFGGVSNIEQEPKSPGVEFQMAFVGPLTSLLLGGLAYLLLVIIRAGTSPLAALLGYLTVSNVLLGIFNLVPAFPLDGGRVLRSILWKISGSARLATRAATVTSQVIAYLLILAGLWLLFGGDLLDGLWLGFIGWFLLNGAQSANVQATIETTTMMPTWLQVIAQGNPLTYEVEGLRALMLGSVVSLPMLGLDFLVLLVATTVLVAIGGWLYPKVVI
jgi:Zn-dependent protease